MLRELDANASSLHVSGHQRGNVLCQALRLATWLAAEGELSRAAIDSLWKLRERVLSLHISSSQALTHAAFAFEDRPPGDRHANVWVSVFALQALLLDPAQCITASMRPEGMDLV